MYDWRSVDNVDPNNRQVQEAFNRFIAERTTCVSSWEVVFFQKLGAGCYIFELGSIM